MPTADLRWGTSPILLVSAEVAAADAACLPEDGVQGQPGWEELGAAGPVAARDFAGNRVLVYVAGSLHGYCIIDGTDPQTSAVSLIQAPELIPDLGDDVMSVAEGLSWQDPDPDAGQTTVIQVGRVAEEVQRVQVTAGDVTAEGVGMDGFFIARIQYADAGELAGRSRRTAVGEGSSPRNRSGSTELEPGRRPRAVRLAVRGLGLCMRREIAADAAEVEDIRCVEP